MPEMHLGEAVFVEIMWVCAVKNCSRGTTLVTCQVVLVILQKFCHLCVGHGLMPTLREHGKDVWMEPPV